MIINKILIVFLLTICTLIHISLLNPLKNNILDSYTREQIYEYSQKKIEEKNFNEAKGYLEFLLNGEQNINKVMQLTTEFGTVLYKLKEYNEAEKIFSFFIYDKDFINNGTNKQKDYAYYMYVKCIFKLQKNTFLKRLIFTFTDKRTRDICKIKKALKVLKKTKKEYPNSTHLSYIKKHCKIIKNHICFHELHIAQYYKNIGNYKAAYWRLKKIKKIRKNNLTNEEKLLKNELIKLLKEKNEQH